jgi:hypothetical protein
MKRQCRTALGSRTEGAKGRAKAEGKGKEMDKWGNSTAEEPFA